MAANNFWRGHAPPRKKKGGRDPWLSVGLSFSTRGKEEYVLPSLMGKGGGGR